jgi:hypothetical protein
MIGMIIFMALRMVIGLIMQAAQYALTAFVMAYVGRKGWEMGKKGR